jgi:hypothetical protein
MAKKKRGSYGEERFPEHESYGLVTWSRVQGKARLFGSPIEPNHFISLRVSDGVRRHGLGDSRYSDGKIQVEIQMSETQFAEFITTPNRGVGTPCTYRYKREGGQLKTCDPPPRQETEASATRRHFEEDVQETMASLKSTRRRIEKLIDETRLGAKRKEEIRDEIHGLLRMFEDSAPFMMARFEENAQKVIGSAKAEITQHARLVAHEVGVETLRASVPNVPLLEGGDDQ